MWEREARVSGQRNALWFSHIHGVPVACSLLRLHDGMRWVPSFLLISSPLCGRACGSAFAPGSGRDCPGVVLSALTPVDAHCGPAPCGSCRAGLQAPQVLSVVFSSPCSYCCRLLPAPTASDALVVAQSLSWTVETSGCCFTFQRLVFLSHFQFVASSLVNSLCPLGVLCRIPSRRAEKNVRCLLSSLRAFSQCLPSAPCRPGRFTQHWTDAVLTP